MLPLRTQIKILRKLRHPHIVNLKEVVTTDEYTYIIMELCVLPDLCFLLPVLAAPAYVYCD